MSELAEDVVTLLTSVGTFGTNIFIGSKEQVPTGGGPFLSLIQYGGMEAERTQNAVATPAYQRPSLQLMARAGTYQAAFAMARAAYNALVGVRNQTVNGTYYRELIPIQEPFDTGLDGAGRPTVTFNIRSVKRP